MPLLPLAAALLAGSVLVPSPAGAVGSPPHGTPVDIPADDFPDPFVLRQGATFYAYGTDGDLGNVQVIRSDDLVTWTNARNGGALPPANTPAWGQPDDVWAPAVLDTGSGVVLYVALLDRTTGRRCIGAATAATPEGPFDGVDAFRLCNDGEGGVIDPHVFTNGTNRHLLWKTEGVPGQRAPALWSQPLATDGLSLSGSPARLLSSRYPWEGTLIENPALATDGNRFYLFYSGNEWESADYGEGWAVCATPQGPCATPPNKPLLRTEGPNLQGPGGGTAFQDENGDWWMAFSAWTAGGTTEETGSRELFFRRLTLAGGRPTLAASDGSFPPQPLAVRVQGPTRYETAAALSAHLVQADRPMAYVATGQGYADALAAGPAAGVEGGPVLLVSRTAAPAAVKTELCRVSPGHIKVAGSTGVVTDAVFDDVRGCADGGSAHREPGTNRYDTAARISANAFGTGAPVVYVVTGEGYADALAAGAAATRNGGPLLLARKGDLPAFTARELDRLDPQRVVVIGGAGVIGENVLTEIRRYAPTVERIAGATRYETATRVARQEFGALIGGLVVATGEDYADAVAAGAHGMPVLLVPRSGAAPAVVKEALDALAPLGVLVAGGEGAVSTATLRSLGL